MNSPPKAPKAPPGRTIVHTSGIQELLRKVKEGAIQEGDSVGSCGPSCGDIVIRRAGENSKNPQRLYAACQAPSEENHRTFMWMEYPEEKQGLPAGSAKRLFPDTQRVPHALVKGIHLVNCPTVSHPAASFSEGSSYILTTGKKCKLLVLQDQRVRLRQPAAEPLDEGKELIADSLGLHSEVSAPPPFPPPTALLLNQLSEVITIPAGLKNPVDKECSNEDLRLFVFSAIPPVVQEEM